MDSKYLGQAAQDALKELGEAQAQKDVQEAFQKMKDLRRHVIYALASDYDYVIFDVELIHRDPESRPIAGAHWCEWEPVALARGPGFGGKPLDPGFGPRGFAFTLADGTRVGAQDCLLGEGGDEVEVMFLSPTLSPTRRA